MSAVARNNLGDQDSLFYAAVQHLPTQQWRDNQSNAMFFRYSWDLEA
jgi:hypothetical protein